MSHVWCHCPFWMKTYPVGVGKTRFVLQEINSWCNKFKIDKFQLVPLQKCIILKLKVIFYIVPINNLNLYKRKWSARPGGVQWDRSQLLFWREICAASRPLRPCPCLVDHFDFFLALKKVRIPDFLAGLTIFRPEIRWANWSVDIF